MTEVDPLTGEEILFIRSMCARRKRVLMAIYGALGTAIAGAIIAGVLS